MPDKPTRWTGLPVNAEMMLAVLAGRKTMTRRVIPMPESTAMCPVLLANDSASPSGHSWVSDMIGIVHIKPRYAVGQGVYFREPLRRLSNIGPTNWVTTYSSDGQRVAIKYGHPVAWRWHNSGIPGRYMPRRLARACGVITEVRAERLQDISKDDVKKEGLRWPHEELIPAFARLCDRLHARDGHGWDSNPYVFAYSWEMLATTWKETQRLLTGKDTQ